MTKAQGAAAHGSTEQEADANALGSALDSEGDSELNAQEVEGEGAVASKLSHTIWFWVGFIAVIGLYAYSISAAIGNWIGMDQLATILADGLSDIGRVWLVVGVAVPALALLVSLLIGVGKKRSTKLLLMVAGLTVVAVLQLDMMHLVPTTTYLG
ncbi:hypothetical protein [Leucobacter chinensis]|uniref:hypothetical protein n=1 Tax=Leucobacter chinensis TaxID=2851010 RepID=UPI001C2403C8|nr:hypothetical protein [Leucobacter chinensis]